jgi:predicted GNAT family N-acyltransferase
MSDALPTLVIEPLAKHHDRADFACGDAELDRYIKEQASQDVKRRVARVFVAASKNRVIGFYSLSATSISRDNLPEDVAKKLPRYPVPAVLLGRLARDSSYHGRKLGEALLVNAMKRALLASHEVAMYALVVDAKNDRAKAFYQTYGFIALQDSPMRLFLPFDTIAELVRS